MIEHVHEFELDFEGNERQLRDFRPRDGIWISIFLKRINLAAVLAKKW